MFARITYGVLAAWLMVVALAGEAGAGAFEDAYARGDYATALAIVRPLADRGEADAQYQLGAMYDQGQGVPQNYAEAVKWYRKAADQGDAQAQFNLGYMYYYGKGVPQDYAEAVKWYRKAADQGFAGAQFNVGLMYDRGKGVPQNDAQAVTWYRKAADHGLADAQLNLGFMYDRGKGVPQNYAEAVKLWRKAADQGIADAQTSLGAMYDQGRGVPQDYAEAVKWYRKAADQGNAPAQTNLGNMYYHGKGVPQDYVQAHMWFNLAASRFSSSEKDNRERAVSNRNIVAKLMTHTQIAEAQRLARQADISSDPSSAVPDKKPLNDPGWDSVFESAGKKYDIDPMLLKAMMYAGSGASTSPVDRVRMLGGINPATGRPTGVGPMQLLPSRFPDVNPYDPLEAIQAAAKYMSDAREKYGLDSAESMLRFYYSGSPDPAKWDAYTNAYLGRVGNYYKKMTDSDADFINNWLSTTRGVSAGPAAVPP